MNVENALAVWSAACDGTDVRWFLFRETLLCATGYQHFPETLSYPQVAVFGEDLPAVVQQVVSRLPNNWRLENGCFGCEKHNLIFYRNESPVFELCVLYGVDNEAQAAAFDDQVKRIVSKVGKRRLLHKIGSIIPLYRETAGILIQRGISRLTDKAFPKLVALAGTSGKKPVFYWEYLTQKKPTLLPARWFCSVRMFSCNGMDYPVFSGYKEYLIAVYGDYENGLNDEIGVGLTAKEKEELKAHQDRSYEALAFIQEISQEFGLRYYLLAGSVLGCVRHGGFIPWDDDIDIGIRIEELERFEQVVKEQLPLRLPEGFSLMQSGPNNPYPRMFSKICYDGRCCIDLWPLVPTYTEGIRAKILWYFAKLITKVHYHKIGHKVTMFHKLVKVINVFLSDRMVMILARRNERKYAYKNTPAYINLYSIYTCDKETIQRNWLDTEATAIFEGLRVPVVGCTEEYLTHLYGDYMKRPAPWKRGSGHCDRFF